MKNIILVAGATGNLGRRIVKALLKQGAIVHAVVRGESDVNKVTDLEQAGVKVHRIKHWSVEELSLACGDVDCVVSALAGLREVIVDAQKVLLDAAIRAGVPRFIPSDYSLDFTAFDNGENRNLDLRREFHEYLDKAPIAATTIFNGAFTDLLPDEMPLILIKKRLVLYWGKADHRMIFTTMDNTAAYTAYAALDPSTPRYLRIAGDQISPKGVRAVASEVIGKDSGFSVQEGRHCLE